LESKKAPSCLGAFFFSFRRFDDRRHRDRVRHGKLVEWYENGVFVSTRPEPWLRRGVEKKWVKRNIAFVKETSP
jgi:hypothetical protein